MVPATVKSSRNLGLRQNHTASAFVSQLQNVFIYNVFIFKDVSLLVFHVPEDCCTAKPRGDAEMRVWSGKRGEEVIAATSILPGDQLTGVFGC